MDTWALWLVWFCTAINLYSAYRSHQAKKEYDDVKKKMQEVIRRIRK